VRAILDTNVLVSAIFFGGAPRRNHKLWADDRFELVLSPAIFDEYLRACARLSASRPGLEYEEVLATIAGHGTLVPDSPSTAPITRDPDDDKFMLCGKTSQSIVVSGDADLHDVAGWQGVEVVRPRTFLGLLDPPAAT